MRLFERKDGTFYAYLDKHLIKKLKWKHKDDLEHSKQGNKYVITKKRKVKNNEKKY